MMNKKMRTVMWTVLMLSVLACTVSCARRVYHVTFKAEKIDAEYEDSLTPKY